MTHDDENRGPVPTADVAARTVHLVTEVARAGGLGEGHLLVVGCSTSEVVGERIGSAGRTDVALAVVGAVLEVATRTGFDVAFQCCEHLNRALVLERTTARGRGYDEVSVVPVPTAGGAAAAAAFSLLHDAVVVEHVTADAGVDIGATLIGMHLRHVAVPFRPQVRTVGGAAVTAATTRPKLIGGARAVYTRA